jgi:hypothetical protein
MMKLMKLESFRQIQNSKLEKRGVVVTKLCGDSIHTRAATLQAAAHQFTRGSQPITA